MSITVINNISTNRYNWQGFAAHIVGVSPWPIIMSFSVIALIGGGVFYMHGLSYGLELTLIGFVLVLIVFTMWFREVTIEGTHLGHHTRLVQKGIITGFGLFVISEGFFFLSIFWAYFHSSLSPSTDLGSLWPPIGIEALNPILVPLLNTILLLSSGIAVTYGHHALLERSRSSAIIGLVLTLIIAIVFTGFQGFEYLTSNFTFADGAYGSCFFFSTGFHGVHVIVGTIFLTVSLFRLYLYHLTSDHHAGYESAILYWHFVDVVWIALYLSVYIWGFDGQF